MKNLFLLAILLGSLALAACSHYPTKTFIGASGWPADQKPIR